MVFPGPISLSGSDMSKQLPFDESLRTWVARNKLKGCNDDDIVEKLTGAGYDRKQCLSEIDQVSRHPYMQAAFDVARQLRQRDGLLETQRLLGAQKGKPSLPVEGGIGGERFLREYYFANRPVHLPSFARHWEVVRHWNPAWFKQHHGDVPVVVQTGREGDPKYYFKRSAFSRVMTFGAYVDLLEAQPMSNDHYFINDLGILAKDGLDLYPHLNPVDGILDHGLRENNFLWMGPGGTITRLHYDIYNYLLVQVFGRKRVWLVPSLQAHLTYNQYTVYSEVDPENPDLERFPQFENATVLEVELNPGDALFLPVGWWHHVKSLDPSISLSFSNFVVPNRYPW